MTPVLLAVAAVTAAGAVAAVAAREPRLATLGMLVALLGGAYVAEPLPGSVALGARLVGTVLAGYLVWVSLRGAPARTAASRLGWPGTAAVAVAGLLAGWLAAVALGATLGGAVPGAVRGAEAGAGDAVTGLAGGAPVARAAMATAFALAALAAGPVLLARDVLRLGLGLLLLIAAADLLRASLIGRVEDVPELVIGLLVAIGGAGVAAVARRCLRLHGDLELRPQASREAAVRSRTTDDAHLVEARR